MTDDSVSRLATVSTALQRAAKLGDHATPTLIAVSKTHDADTIRPLLDAGHRVFGENRVQEAAAKWPALRADYPGVELHLIGQLQSNKAEDAVALFDVIHTVDRPSLIAGLAQAMDKIAAMTAPKREAMGARAHAKYLTRYSVDAMAKTLRGIYDREFGSETLRH